MVKKFLILIAFFTSLSTVVAQKKAGFIEAVNAANPWADSVLATMSTREKIAQLMMPAAYSNKNGAHVAEIAQLVATYKVGGLCFFQGTAQKQAELTNYYQNLSATPLMISMDAEWGVGMRLDSVLNFPFQIALGAANNDSLTYRMGAEVARQFKLLGMHVNFAPVADVNSNPENPVINVRAFGEDKEEVTRQSIAYMRGLQDNGVLACAKHFPGHGNTDKDSHHEVPTLKMSRDTFYNIDLYPFKKLINNGLSSMMVSHLSVPALDSTGELASLSPKIADGLLRKELKFKGLVFSDGMQMKAVTHHYQSPQANLHALLAGNDMLVFPVEIPASIDTIERAVSSGVFPLQLLDQKCLRVLKAKYWLGLNGRKAVEQRDWSSALNTGSAKLVRTQLIEQALTLVNNKNGMLPIKDLDTLKIAYVEVSKKEAASEFYNTARLYANIDRFTVDQSRRASYDSLEYRLRDYNLLIVGYLDINQRAPQRSFGMDSAFCTYLRNLAAQKRTVLSLFANPYTLAKLGASEQFEATLIAYNGGDDYQRIAAEAIFGGVAISGKSPVTVPGLVALHQGLTTRQTRLKYGSPEELGIAPERLATVDTLVKRAIAMQAFPGCQVLAAHRGVVFYQKSFGYHSYQNEAPVRNSDLFDIASVTKVTATLPVVMSMVDKGELKLGDNLGEHLSLEEGCNKSALKLSDILLHQSGLKAWMPVHVNFMHPVFVSQPLLSVSQSDSHPFKLYANTYLNKFHTLDTALFKSEPSAGYPYTVAKGIYAHQSIKQKVYALMDESELQDKKYRYSDLGFYYLQRVVEARSGVGLDTISDKFFYKKLGMTSTGFLPLRKFSIEDIVPTEWEYPFRHQLIHGYVHDHGAATVGGVAGHAGVFSTANDMAKMMQMYLWKGSYGGEQLISAKTVGKFTQCQGGSDNRRGYGFDKPEMNPQKANPVCSEASPDSYGHSGFTGTLVWVDPQRELVYVFLSNRVHPDNTNNQITTTNVRTNVLREFINAVDEVRKK